MLAAQRHDNPSRTPFRWLLGIAILGIVLGVAVHFGRDAGPASATGGVLSISAGYRHTCAALAGGEVKCWGSNEDGQLGDGTNNNSDTPVDVCVSGSGIGCSGGERLTGIVEVAAGFGHSCARTADGSAMCWGRNTQGQLGDGTMTNRPVAVTVCASGSGPSCAGGEPLSGVEEIDVGTQFSCALMSNTGIKCWGTDEVGQLGIGTEDPEAGSAAPAGGFGGNSPLPLDVCEPTLIAVPLAASSAGGLLPCEAVTGFVSVATGAEHACAITTESGAKCWGGAAPLGDGTDDNSGSPVDVCTFPLILVPLAGTGPSGGAECVPVSNFAQIDAGFRHTCALTTTGGVKCWGSNFNGRLGDGTEDDRLTPVSVCASGNGFGCGDGIALGGMVAVVAGSGYGCAISEAGDARCWGANTGDGSGMVRLNPIAVSGLSSGVIEIAGGARGSHACAGTDDGALRCWGPNDEGQLGLGFTGSGSNVPSTVTGFGTKPTATSTATATPTAVEDTPTPVQPTDTPEPGASATPTPVPGGLVGDVDCSGAITAIDAAFLLQFNAGLITALPCPQNADANEDGEINTIDAALILQLSAGLLGSLPP